MTPTPEGSHPNGRTADNVVQLPEHDDWPEPAPLRAIVTPPDFPTDALPRWLRDYVAAEANATQVPVDLAGMCAIATISTALQGRRNALADNERWAEPICIYTAIAMNPGERKSATFAHLTRPLEEWELDVRPENAAAVAASAAEARELEDNLDAIQRTLKDANKNVRTKSHDAATTPDELRAAMGDRDTARQDLIAAELAFSNHVQRHHLKLILDDTTPEAAAEQAYQQGERFAILSDEGDVLDTFAGRYTNKQANIALLKKAHSRSFVSIARKGKAPVDLNGPTATIGLCIQPHVLTKIGRNEDFHGEGLLARFLFVTPRPMVGRRLAETATVPARVRAAYDTGIKAIASHAYSQDALTNLIIDPAADRLLIDFQQDLEPRLDPDTGDLAQAGIAEWASKLTGAILRLAAIIATAREQRIPEAITAEDMTAALSFRDYLIAHATLAFSHMSTAANGRLLSWLIAKIQRSHLSTIHVRTFMHENSLPNGTKAEDLNEALEDLSRLGYTKRITESLKPFRCHWAINPRIHLRLVENPT